MIEHNYSKQRRGVMPNYILCYLNITQMETKNEKMDKHHNSKKLKRVINEHNANVNEKSENGAAPIFQAPQNDHAYTRIALLKKRT